MQDSLSNCRERTQSKYENWGYTKRNLRPTEKPISKVKRRAASMRMLHTTNGEKQKSAHDRTPVLMQARMYSSARYTRYQARFKQ